ncbi:Siderophore synthetase component [Atopomonas hussainii]|uniref:Siderophore synthetase component n=1 Tax=Atopomonas hussainii TaxID=1429083 RepID=A0A1H7MFL2_9GAMM|nr:IucA/IucC family protein [Atopomonas hussainii]SEL10120.1 Siderophore synthetase component [Atopomonas hussainii]
MFKDAAERLSVQALLNCYWRETGLGTVQAVSELPAPLAARLATTHCMALTLQPLAQPVWVPLSYVSPTGRHRIGEAVFSIGDGGYCALPAALLFSLLLSDLAERYQGGALPAESADILGLCLQSLQNMRGFISSREADIAQLYGPELDFFRAEQGLLIGHQTHPAPKSRNGFTGSELAAYSPEAAGRCQLHWWLLAPGLVKQHGVWASSPSSQLRDWLTGQVSPRAAALLAANPSWDVLPLHPWQARHLLGREAIAALIEQGQLLDLGEQGPALWPTSSIRTLAAPGVPWMFKCSLSVAITNSVRINLFRECLRGELGCRLWQGPLGDELKERLPTLRPVNDPAWLTLEIDGQVLDEATCILRDNPFAVQAQVSCMAMLCQDHPLQRGNRFSQLLPQLAQREGISTQAAAEQWFAAFIRVAVEPMLTLYLEYGMAFEAHQQNTLLELENLWPARFWVRDNQGFYYIEERAQRVLELLPELGGAAESVGPQSFVDERFHYYFFHNTVFGLINALGHSGLADEHALLGQLRAALTALDARYPGNSLLAPVLHAPTLPYKGNLLTRLAQIDELVAPLTSQSVYVELHNPLYEVNHD